uniref:Uncharacterized protein n=1 Tax=Anopheles funestus TaxID=62324 RepID=A0A182S452_ANOFN
MISVCIQQNCICHHVVKLCALSVTIRVKCFCVCH